MKRLFLPMALAYMSFFLQGAGRASVPEVKPAPSTSKQPVTDLYHRVAVRDDFRWLEQLSDAKVKAWAESQNERAQEFLNALPGRARIGGQIKKLISSIPPSLADLQLTGGKIFAFKFDPARQQRFIVVLSSPDDPGSEKIICDPNVIDTSGTTSADWFVPSPDGKIIAVSLSKHGTEDGDLCFFDAETGKQLPDVIKHVQFPTAGGSAAWTRDSKGVFYTRYPREGERTAEDRHFYQQVYFHQLGSPESADTYSIGKEFLKLRK